MPLPCVRCGFQLASSGPEADGENSPYAGTAFVTHGHYGSTIFDPMDGTYLEVNVCDPCLRDAAQQGRALIGQDHRPVRKMEEIPYRERPPLRPWEAPR